MQTPRQYAKQQIEAGAYPNIIIEPGQFGTFWLHDGDWKMLECRGFTSRDDAERERSKAIRWASARVPA